MAIVSNDKDHVQRLYVRQNTLTARLSLHEKYSTNPYGWANWVFDQYELRPGMRVLELGCGTGSVWQGHADRLPEDIHILLTDFSETMLESARANLGADPRFSFEQMDIQSIPCASDAFDAVIANHMLYHVPDIGKALSEVARVLKPGGRFYATTLGANTQRELRELYEPFEGRIVFTYPANSPFLLQNGAAQLAAHFPNVEMREYPDSLAVTDPEDLISYIQSLQSIPPELQSEFVAHIRAAFVPGEPLRITKEQGIFICAGC